MSSSPEAAIVARDLRKTFRVFSERNQTLKQAILRRRRAVYEEFVAVDGVSFEVAKGSTFGIVGSNGSGKSTTLKVLAKILEPDGGSVTVNGRISALLELGAGFHPELSGRENVFLNAAILGIPRKQVDRSFDAIVEFAEIGKFIDNPVKTYSSGMYARLGFAVAVNVDPDVLLIDEVLAVGDEHFQRRCAEKIDDLRSDGRTVVIVSHGLGSIQSLCDHAIWIDKGVMRANGKPNDVVDAYVRSVHPDVVTDAHGGVHIGSGQIRINAVTVEGGVPLLTGAPGSFIIKWDASESMEQAVLTLSIRRIDGVKVGSVSTDQHRGSGIDISAGAGEARFELPCLPMLPGTYEVDAQITDITRAHVVDRVTHATRFDVASDGGLLDADGVVMFQGQWERL
jgi:ABC-2 type transport system ATP-binding protein